MTRARDVANVLSTATSLATDSETAAAISSHSSANDPHAGYVLESLFDASGDLIYASAADTPARLAIGSTDQVLKVSGGLPVWGTSSGGGMTVLASGTLSGSTINMSSISGSYNSLQLVIRNFDPVGDNEGLFVRFNGDTGTNYFKTTSGSGGFESFNASSFKFGSNSDNGTSYSMLVLDLPDYSFAGNWKIGTALSIVNNQASPDNLDHEYSRWCWKTPNTFVAISEINLFTTTSGFSGGTYVLYGIK